MSHLGGDAQESREVLTAVAVLCLAEQAAGEARVPRHYKGSGDTGAVYFYTDLFLQINTPE